MNLRLYNNFGIIGLGIAYTSEHYGDSLPLSMAFLVAPIIAHKKLLDHLGRKGVEAKNIEKLLVNKTDCFSNFSDRYYDGLCETMNAIQFLVDGGFATLAPKGIRLSAPVHYSKDMGRRAAKIHRASSNIATILKGDAAYIYSSLRIRL